ncbi:MAG: hypothetical protein RI988_5 [Pseudomonadota bacterium]|jgi:predicted DNA-binding transcriptional regulator AlpA
MAIQTTRTTASRKAVAGHQPRLTILPATGFIRQRDLIPTFVPWSSATLWREVGKGTFPTPVKLSAGVTAWRIEDIHGWINSRAQ